MPPPCSAAEVLRGLGSPSLRGTAAAGVRGRAPGNRCRRFPAQCRPTASSAYPGRPILVLYASAQVLSARRPVARGQQLRMRRQRPPCSGGRAKPSEEGASVVRAGVCGGGKVGGRGRALTHQQGARDAPKRHPCRCPHDRPLLRSPRTARAATPPPDHTANQSSGGPRTPQRVPAHRRGRGRSSGGLRPTSRHPRPMRPLLPRLHGHRRAGVGGRGGGRRGAGAAQNRRQAHAGASGAGHGAPTCRHRSARLPISSSGRTVAIGVFIFFVKVHCKAPPQWR